MIKVDQVLNRVKSSDISDMNYTVTLLANLVAELHQNI